MGRQCFISENDAQMMIDKLKTKKDHFPDFSFKYFQGSEDDLCDLFWVDEEAKQDYIALWIIVDNQLIPEL